MRGGEEGGADVPRMRMKDMRWGGEKEGRGEGRNETYLLLRGESSIMRLLHLQCHPPTTGKSHK